MPAKRIHYGDLARHKLLRGVDVLARSVEGTLGPRSGCAAIEKAYGPPLVINDGATIAREIQLADPVENMGARLLNEVAAKTNDTVGDGTTTAVILARAILREGVRLVAAGYDPMALKRGVEMAVDAVVQALENLAAPARGNEDMIRVASISANNDKAIGRIVADALDKAGSEGVVTIEEGKSLETTLETLEGMRFDKGYISPYFVTDTQKMTCELNAPLILVCDKKISASRDLMPLLEQALQADLELLIIAEDVSGEALALLVVNKLRGVLSLCSVKAPGFGENRKAMLDDLAVLTGGEVVSETLGLKMDSVSIERLGRADKVLVGKDSTTIIGSRGTPQAIQGRIAQIRNAIENSSSEYERDKLRERLARLTGGVCVLHVGGATESEIKEKKSRVEDALNATRAAGEEGVVPGGGVALIRCEQALDSLQCGGMQEQAGVGVIRSALSEPLRAIAKNSGKDPGLTVERVRDGKNGFGFNAATLVFEDLVRAGVIDPKKVTRIALQNAASIASLLLTAEAVVSLAPKRDLRGAEPASDEEQWSSGL